jgi:hypothetical protein
MTPRTGLRRSRRAIGIRRGGFAGIAALRLLFEAITQLRVCAD